MNDTILFAGHDERPIESDQVRRLYETVTWGHNRDIGGIAESIERSVTLGAWHGDKLVGFVRALSDGRYRAYIEDVMIDPEYRGRTIGERMVAALLEQLDDIEVISLFCLPERVRFYERNGFERSPRQVMMHKRSEYHVPQHKDTAPEG